MTIGLDRKIELIFILSLGMKEILKKRSFLYAQIREFFLGQQFLEVETPLLLTGLIPESSIEVFKTTGKSLDRDDQDYFLPPSPEISMKMLLAADSGDIFQICKAFRNCEEEGPHHSREFSMLEWYKTGIDAVDNLDITENLLRSILPSEFKFPFPRVEVDKLFLKYVGFSFVEHNDKKELSVQAESLGLTVESDDTRESLFNKIFLTYVEPELKHYPGVFLCGYPAFVPTLAAKNKANPLLSDRWELYLNGVEIANCYSEETEFSQIDLYIKEEKLLKSQSLMLHPIPSEFIGIFEKGLFPRCSGVAMGLDRLLLIVVKKHSLVEIIPQMSSMDFRGDK